MVSRVSTGVFGVLYRGGSDDASDWCSTVCTGVVVVIEILMLDRVPRYGVSMVWLFVTIMSTVRSEVSCIMIRGASSMFDRCEMRVVGLGVEEIWSQLLEK